MTRRLVLLGCGYTLERLALQKASGGGQRVLASTRDSARAQRLRDAGVEVFADHLALTRDHAAGADVVYSLPPDAGLDEALARVLDASGRPRRLVYLSSTGVYGGARGVVTEQTPVDETPGTAGAKRLRAERLLAPLGAVSLRVAGIYGPGRGLHERLRRGGYALPGDGSGRISRIHVDDLVGAIHAVLEADDAALGNDRTFNVADDEAPPQREVVAWLCAAMGVPMPGTLPLEAAPATLRGDRTLSNSRLKSLGWRPRFPSFREGFSELIGTARAGEL